MQTHFPFQSFDALIYSFDTPFLSRVRVEDMGPCLSMHPSAADLVSSLVDAILVLNPSGGRDEWKRRRRRV